MNILFWNLRRNPITGYVKECLLENQVDIAVFAEHEGLDRAALEGETGYRLVKGLEDEYLENNRTERIGKMPMEKIVLFTSNTVQAVMRRRQERHNIYTVFQGNNHYILAGIHLPDRMNNESAVRMMYIRELLLDINKWEEIEQYHNIVIIGDFNANPYDKELLQADSFNAVLFKDVIRQEEMRVMQNGKKKYRRFYNPVLNFISEEPKNYGSYYYSKNVSSPIWNCLDQILVSKSLIDDVAHLQYLRTVGDMNLLKKVRPNRFISDHLPLLVQLGGE